MKKLTFLLLLCAICSGCVSTKRLDPAAISQMSGKTIRPVSLSAKTPFDIMTCGNASYALFGAIGGAVYATTDIGKDADLIDRYEVQDPSIYIADRLTSTASARYRLTRQPAVKMNSDDADPKKIVAATSSADYILSVQTTSWSFCYYPVNWKTYRPILGVHVQLIEAKSGTVVAQKEKCIYSKAPAEQGLSFDQLIQNNAQGIKSSFKTLSDELIRDINEDIF